MKRDHTAYSEHKPELAAKKERKKARTDDSGTEIGAAHFVTSVLQNCYHFAKALALEIFDTNPTPNPGKIDNIGQLQSGNSQTASIQIEQASCITIELEDEDPPLSPSTLGQYQSAQKKSDKLCRLLAQIEGLNLEVAKALLSKNEVSSFIIDEFFTMIAEKSEDFPVKSLDSGFAQSVNFFDQLKNPLRYKKLREDLQNAKVILWPVCSGDPGTKGNHWYLLFFEKNEDNSYSIHCIDGLNSEQRKNYLLKGEAFLQALYPAVAPEILIAEKSAIDIPPQKNAYDCGPVISLWAAWVIHTLSQESSDDVFDYFAQFGGDYYPFRKKMAQELVDYHAALKVKNNLVKNNLLKN